MSRLERFQLELFYHSLHILEKLLTVSLKRFFVGAKMNIPVDIDIKIHLLGALKVFKIDSLYPSTRAQAFDIGYNVLTLMGHRLILSCFWIPLLICCCLRFK